MADLVRCIFHTQPSNTVLHNPKFVKIHGRNNLILYTMDRCNCECNVCSMCVHFYICVQCVCIQLITNVKRTGKYMTSAQLHRCTWPPYSHNNTNLFTCMHYKLSLVVCLYLLPIQPDSYGTVIVLCSIQRQL